VLILGVYSKLSIVASSFTRISSIFSVSLKVSSVQAAYFTKVLQGGEPQPEEKALQERLSDTKQASNK